MACVHRLLNRNLLKIAAQKISAHRGMCDIKNIDNQPVKFSSSKAATWKAEYTRSGESVQYEMPWYQGYVIIFSVSTFLIYFCVLREENDIDQLLEKPLYDRIEGLEETQLKLSLRHNIDRGLPTADIQRRLDEIMRNK